MNSIGFWLVAIGTILNTLAIWFLVAPKIGELFILIDKLSKLMRDVIKDVTVFQFYLVTGRKFTGTKWSEAVDECNNSYEAWFKENEFKAILEKKLGGKINGRLD